MAAKRSFVWVLSACALILAMAGGAAKKPARPVSSASTDPDAVYARSSPYDRLYVEVDTVQGAVVDPRWLTELKAFLVEYGNKPAGVRVVRNTTIPLAKVKGLSPNEIAGTNIGGPPAGPAARRTAFIYVLFYDSRELGYKKPDNPHVSYADYPCAIYFDTAYGRGAQRAFAVNALRHEAGHVLGLCKSRAHGDGAHCRNPNCLMYPTLMLSPKWYLRPPPRKSLCQACRKDLRSTQAVRADSRFSFAGPVLVRRERGYWVLSTPGLVSLVFDPREAADWRGMLGRYRQWVRQRSDDQPQGIYTAWRVEAKDARGIARMKSALADARRDSSWLVQAAAKDAESHFEADLAKRASKTPGKALAAARKRPNGRGHTAATVE